MAWYNIGTISIAAGDTLAVGTGTEFLDNVRVGDGLTVQGNSSIYQITNIASDTQITFDPPFTGAAVTNVLYAIVPVQGYVKLLADRAAALIDSFDAPNVVGLANLTSAPGAIPFFIDTAGTMDVIASTLFGRSLLTSTDAASTRTTLGATTIGNTLFTTPDAATARTAIGATVVGNAVFTATDAAAGRAALGSTTIGDAMFIVADAASARTLIGAAGLGSPTFTGVPLAPTAAVGTNTTQIATTEFVLANAVQKDSNVGAAQLPSGTTAQRPANGAGKFRYNTDLGRPEVNNGTNWGSLGGATGGGNDAVFYLNGQTVNTSFTVPSGQNAGSFGPITIANGVTVTVSDGSVWTVV